MEDNYMQQVFTNGSLGAARPFDPELLEKLLQDKNVDHVRLFDLERGNKVGIPEIEEKNIEMTVERIVDEKLKDRAMVEKQHRELEILVKQFNDKTTNRF